MVYWKVPSLVVVFGCRHVVGPEVFKGCLRQTVLSRDMLMSVGTFVVQCGGKKNSPQSVVWADGA